MDSTFALRPRARSDVARPSWSSGHDALDDITHVAAAAPAGPAPADTAAAADETDAGTRSTRRRSEGAYLGNVAVGLLGALPLFNRSKLRQVMTVQSDGGGPEENSDAVLPQHRPRRLRLRTVAIAVRAWMALLRAQYRGTQVLYEPNQLEDGRQLVRAATVDALVVLLTPLDLADQELMQDILLTLRYFTTVREFLDKLLARFQWKPDDDTKSDVVPLRIINLLKRWMKECPYDFEDEVGVTSRLNRFIMNEVTHNDSLARWADPLNRLLSDMTGTRGQLKRSQSLLDPVSSVGSPNQRTPPLSRLSADFTAINPVDIFRQLTLIEVALFKTVTPRDLFYKTVERRHDHCPAVLKLIDHFNRISFWVAKEVCFCGNLKQRVVILKRFIYIAHMCMEWKNFNTCLEIVGGLTMASVQRLKKTWKNLPSKYLAMWREVQAITSPRQNYIAYRNHLKKLEPPLLPYVGVLLSDLTFLQEKYPITLAGGLVNVSKLRMISQIIIEIQKLQVTCQYPFIENGLVRQFLELDTDVVSEDALYEASRTAESSQSETPQPPRSINSSSPGSSATAPSSPLTVGRSWRGTITPLAVTRKNSSGGASSGSGGERSSSDLSRISDI